VGKIFLFSQYCVNVIPIAREVGNDPHTHANPDGLAFLQTIYLKRLQGRSGALEGQKRELSCGELTKKLSQLIISRTVRALTGTYPNAKI
jgi:hypothetical protein